GGIGRAAHGLDAPGRVLVWGNRAAPGVVQWHSGLVSRRDAAAAPTLGADARPPRGTSTESVSDHRPRPRSAPGDHRLYRTLDVGSDDRGKPSTSGHRNATPMLEYGN